MKEQFEAVRQRYPGTKRGLETELSQFQRHKDHKAVIDLLLPALEAAIQRREERTKKGQWNPDWPHFRTWISQRRWEENWVEEVKTEKLDINYCNYSTFE